MQLMYRYVDTDLTVVSKHMCKDINFYECDNADDRSDLFKM